MNGLYRWMAGKVMITYSVTQTFLLSQSFLLSHRLVYTGSSREWVAPKQLKQQDGFCLSRLWTYLVYFLKKMNKRLS